MKKIITKFPKGGENPFVTKIEIQYIENQSERDEITSFIEGLGFETSEGEDQALIGIFKTTEPKKAEETVRSLGRAGFTEPGTARYTTATPSQKSTC